MHQDHDVAKFHAKKLIELINKMDQVVMKDEWGSEV
jgi:hypothetical protein